jgi:phage gpG-like protein
MDLHQLEINLQEMLGELQDFANNDAPEIIGKMAKDFYKESFQNEGFTDKDLGEWPEVERRKNPKRPERSAATRKILTGSTGNLGRSIEYYTEKGAVTIRSEVYSPTGFNYAPVHNWGTDKIPQRQFVGDSETLNEKILERMREKAREITRK